MKPWTAVDSRLSGATTVIRQYARDPGRIDRLAGDDSAEIERAGERCQQRLPIQRGIDFVARQGAPEERLDRRAPPRPTY